MMGEMKFVGLLAVIPTAVLLTISFFVLVVNKKQEQPLKAFGYVVAAVLWVAALFIFSLGIYVTAKGGPKCMKMEKMQHMMKGGMPGQDSTMKGEMPRSMKGAATTR